MRHSGTYIWWGTLTAGTERLKKKTKQMNLMKINQIFGGSWLCLAQSFWSAFLYRKRNRRGILENFSNSEVKRMERIKMRKSGMAIFLLGACVLMLAACGNETEHREKLSTTLLKRYTRNLLEETEEENGKTGDIQMQKMIVEVSGQRFEADLFDNETVQALRDRLPMTINMEELHGNEKYDYLDEELPSNPENIGSIKTGISCCLALIVLFCFSRTLILLTTTPGLVI